MFFGVNLATFFVGATNNSVAIANGEVFELSARGWDYTLVPTFLTGVAAHGLLVFAQRTIQIGTIGIAQVAQPALAVAWSFLLLDETVRSRQVESRP